MLRHEQSEVSLRILFSERLHTRVKIKMVTRKVIIYYSLETIALKKSEKRKLKVKK